jgi:ParB family chromosome partitioning protein
MRLLNLPNEVQLALKEGLITMGHAKAIAGIDAEQQLWALKRCLKKALSVRQMEELARKLSEQSTTEPALEEEYPESYSRLVEQLEPYFSENISIKRSKSGGGKIVIDFSNDEEIEQFIERLRNK